MSDWSGITDEKAPRSSATWVLSLLALFFFVLFVVVMVGVILAVAGVWDWGVHGFLP